MPETWKQLALAANTPLHTTAEYDCVVAECDEWIRSQHRRKTGDDWKAWFDWRPWTAVLVGIAVLLLLVGMVLWLWPDSLPASVVNHTPALMQALSK